VDKDGTAHTLTYEASEGEANEPPAWSVRSQIAFVVVAAPVILFLVVVAPYLLTHYIINPHDRFNYVPPPLGGDRALEGHWTDGGVGPALVWVREGDGRMIPMATAVAQESLSARSQFSTHPRALSSARGW
jgi:hypothetical protein